MTTPTILPSIYAGTAADYRVAKADKAGGPRLQYTTVTVPVSTATSTVIGLIPFQKGARLSYGGTQLYVENIGDSSLTLDVGYHYATGSSETDDPDAFASALTTGQAGGFITFDEATGLSWVAADDGWITVKTGGSITDNAGVIKGQLEVVYDGLTSVN